MKKSKAIRIALDKLDTINTVPMNGVDVITLGSAQRILHSALKHNKDCRHCAPR